jgi:hypothetical protein
MGDMQRHEPEDRILEKDLITARVFAVPKLTAHLDAGNDDPTNSD